jgi:2'-5' RNA ligase
MLRHRVFLSISLTEKIKNRLSKYKENLSSLPAKWVKRDNLHITLIFLGDSNEKEIGYIGEALKKESSKHSPFNLFLNKISYFPENKIPPRMICATGESTKEILDLRKGIEKALLERGVHFPLEMKKFNPHVTLARIRAWDWRKIEPDERPEVTEDININLEVKSIELVESKLKRGGPEYTILERAKLRD